MFEFLDYLRNSFDPLKIPRLEIYINGSIDLEKEMVYLNQHQFPLMFYLPKIITIYQVESFSLDSYNNLV
jgi:hypothetical protein